MQRDDEDLNIKHGTDSNGTDSNTTDTPRGNELHHGIHTNAESTEAPETPIADAAAEDAALAEATPWSADTTDDDFTDYGSAAQRTESDRIVVHETGIDTPTGVHRGRNFEPAIDPDSKKRVAEEIPDPAHPASRFDAGTGQGTSTRPKSGSLQERPVLDGSTQNPMAEASVPNPSRGQTDPAMMSRQPALNSTSTDRWLISACVATIVVTIVLLLLAQWNPVLCITGVLVAVLGLIGMLLVRASKMELKRRLRVDAVLLAIIWLVPLAVLIFVLATSADAIWG